jgi:hypothetical protein
MLADKTVLILGAGASYAECNFPMGFDLLKSVYELCSQPTARDDFHQLLTDCRINPGAVQNMARAIGESHVTSIDLLLQHRHEFIDAGKCAIAYTLAPYESTRNVGAINRRSGSWYSYLFDLLRGERFEQFGANELTIVTYNYDRSIDYYLRRCLRTLYNQDARAVEEAMKGIPIIHLHGQLGNLAEHPYVGPPERTSGVDLNYIEALARASKGIKIIHEIDDADHDTDYQKARVAIRSAKRVVILGFGFGKENLKRLRLGEATGEMFATGYGMTLLECGAVKTMCRRDIVFSNVGEEILPFLRRLPCLPTSD